jgi:hypothetical protein
MTKLVERSGLALLNELIKDPDRKPLWKIIYELLYLFFLYREIPVHYFSRYLFKKGIINIKNYLPNKLLCERVTPNFNDKTVKDVLDNKLFFDFFYSQFNISLPRIIMYNFKKIFVLSKNATEVKSVGDFKELLLEIFRQNPSYESIFIKKTNSSSCGSNIYKLFLYQVNGKPEVIDEIYFDVIRSGFLFQETINQHRDLIELNSSCLNTIRMDTFVDNNGEANIISAYLRMSINDQFVDNISSGGCQVGINLQTGKLKKFGYGPIKIFGIKVFTEHPKSKIVFENFNVPFFPQIKELVLKAAIYIPGLRLVGWDIAIGASGPVLIEGNSDYDITGNDLADGGYFANPTFRKAFHEIKYL